MTNRERAVEILADRNATDGDLLWALAQLLRTLPDIDIEGIRLNGPRIVARIEDCGVICDSYYRRDLTQSARKSRLTRDASTFRWNFG